MARDRLIDKTRTCLGCERHFTPNVGGAIADLCCRCYNQQRRHPDRPIPPLANPADRAQEVITFRVSEQLLEQVRAAALTEQITVSMFIRRALRRTLKEEGP